MCCFYIAAKSSNGVPSQPATIKTSPAGQQSTLNIVTATSTQVSASSSPIANDTSSSLASTAPSVLAKTTRKVSKKSAQTDKR